MGLAAVARSRGRVERGPGIQPQAAARVAVMSSYDPLLTAAFAVLGAIIGLIVRWRLATLAYRRDDEVTQPSPGPRWWVPAAVAAASGLLAWRFGLDRWPLLLPTLPLALMISEFAVGTFFPTKSGLIGSSRCPRSTIAASLIFSGLPNLQIASSAARAVRPVYITSSVSITSFPVTSKSMLLS